MTAGLKRTLVTGVTGMVAAGQPSSPIVHRVRPYPTTTSASLARLEGRRLSRADLPAPEPDWFLLMLLTSALSTLRAPPLTTPPSPISPPGSEGPRRHLHRRRRLLRHYGDQQRHLELLEHATRQGPRRLLRSPSVPTRTTTTSRPGPTSRRSPRSSPSASRSRSTTSLATSGSAATPSGRPPTSPSSSSPRRTTKPPRWSTTTASTPTDPSSPALSAEASRVSAASALLRGNPRRHLSPGSASSATSPTPRVNAFHPHVQDAGNNDLPAQRTRPPGR